MIQSLTKPQEGETAAESIQLALAASAPNGNNTLISPLHTPEGSRHGSDEPAAAGAKSSTKKRKSKKMRGGVTVRAQDLKTRLPEDMFGEIREMHPLLTPKLTNATITVIPIHEKIFDV